MRGGICIMSPALILNLTSPAPNKSSQPVCHKVSVWLMSSLTMQTSMLRKHLQLTHQVKQAFEVIGRAGSQQSCPCCLPQNTWKKSFWLLRLSLLDLQESISQHSTIAFQTQHGRSYSDVSCRMGRVFCFQQSAACFTELWQSLSSFCSLEAAPRIPSREWASLCCWTAYAF